MDKNETQVKKNAERQRHILIVVFISIFVILTAACVFLMMHTPKGMGPQAVSPMTEDSENTRTGAMFDPNREVRGIWVPSVLNLTFPSEAGLSAEAMRAELDAIVETVRDANLNTICFQVRPSADALYDSDLFPTSLYLSGEQGQPADNHFDPLAYLCEIAAGEDETDAIAVYAWINPLRVTCSGQDIQALSEDNPAVLHPEWTFTYQNACYFNAGIPEVRTLISDGVKEICEKYPVAGIIFDDYFYPYPTYANDGTLLQPDDAETYHTYGSGYETIADFRRGSVNEMVKMCYDTVKSVSEYIRFGIAPFGIWQNDNGSNGGSDTGGMEAYSAIYCDALAWMRGGYVDFIAPQIYWQFSTSAARYDTLVRWWNAQCDAYGIPMWISHAIYQYETWNNPGEMRNQITFARAEASYRGSLFYGYPQLKGNTLGVTDELRDVFSEDILYYEKETVYRDNIETETPIHINVPANNSRYDEEGTYILGQSDPASPLFCDGEPVSRTRSGYFTLYKPLKQGENTFVFTQNGVEYRHTVWKGQYAPVTQTPDETDKTDENITAAETESGTPSSDTVPFIPLTVSVVSPTALTAVYWEEGIAVSVRANADASVTVVLGTDGETALEPTVLTQGETYADGSALYTAVISLPQTDAGTYTDCGSLLITAEKEGYEETPVISGAHIYALGAGAVIPVTVTGDGTSLKTSPDSWYYDDYIPTSSGMTASAYEIRDGYARISLAGNTAYLDALGIKVSDTVPSGMAQFGRPEIQVTEKETMLCIPATESVPVHCVKNGTAFSVILYRGEYTADAKGTLGENPLLSDYSASSGGEEENAYVTFTFNLLERDRFYGFQVLYENDMIQIQLRNPQPIDPEEEKPLAGKTIVLDAGHGGADTGALTPGSHLAQNEKDCNLAIVLEAEKRLTELGADVILLREEDTTVDIYARMDTIDRINPDLMLSIHQNSMPQNTDISHIRGVVGLYWTESGRSLADCVAESVSVALGRYKRDTAGQRLAMLRNYKFPAALIEIGFVTNAEEFEKLCSPGGYEKAAQAVCDGILDWFQTQS